MRNTARKVADEAAEAYERGSEASSLARAIELPLFEALAESMRKPLLEVVWDAAKRNMAAVGIDDSKLARLVNVDALNWAEARAAEMVGKKWIAGKLVDNPNAQWAITESTRDAIKGVVERAYRDGHTVYEVRREIRDNYLFSDQRAKMIAQTELNRASSQGVLIGWRRSGLVTGKTWHMSADHPADSKCECEDNAAAGEIPLDEDFPSGDDGPPAHPNCFCYLNGVLGPEEGEPEAEKNESESNDTERN